MNKYYFLILLLFPIIVPAQQLRVKRLLCEYQSNPIGIDAKQPHLNWQIASKLRNVQQKAYRIIVADNQALLAQNEGNIWDSKKVVSDESIQVPYLGKALLPAKTYYWKVMIWDNYGNKSAWSAPSSWQMGLLDTSDWANAQWIGYEKLPDSLKIVPAEPDLGNAKRGVRKDILPLLRTEVSINKTVSKATVFICGLGQFEISLNGTKIGDHFLDPGWTKYDKQAQYVTFDITRLIKQGSNAFGVMLGNGFYYIPGERYRKITGAYGYPKMICRMVLQYQDGTVENVISDNTWKTSAGPVTFSSIYGGEDFDSNLLQPGWDKPGFNAANWRNAVVVDGPAELDAQAQPPLKIFEHFSVKKILHPKPGVWIYDFGQNASGIPSISLKGSKGTLVKITPAELLDNDSLANQKYIGAPVYFNLRLKGDGIESWQPRFMYYGFRYLQIEGAVPANQPNQQNVPVVTNIQALHTRSAAERTGDFTCSSALFNKTFKLIDWAIQSNTSSIFTDCPHREKLGWLEEAHLVGSSIRYNYNIATLCRKVIKDMMTSQTAEGLIPDIAPEYVKFGGGFRDSPEWGSNGVILPWYVYQWYGDKQVLKDSYSMMQRYVNYLESKSKNHILYFGLGDWYDIGPKEPGVSQRTPGGITSTAIYYYDLTILRNIAALLGKPDDEKKYTDLALDVKQAFNKTFFNKATNQYGTGSQTANAMAIYMGLAEPQDKAAVLKNLVTDLQNHHYSLTSGDIGYRYLLRVLDDAGLSDVIYNMNSRADVPGYGYQLAHGATALTESWQAFRNSSNNHFMLGHLMEWFYSGLGGMKTADNDIAFHTMRIRPEAVGDIDAVNTHYDSPYGTIAVNWKKSSSAFVLNVTIPANTRARIYLPANQSSVVTESGKPVFAAGNIKYAGYQDGRKIYEVGSGKYLFSSNGQ